MFLLQLNTVLLKKKDTVSWYPWWKEKKKILSMSVANEKCRWWHNLLSRKFPKGSVCLEHDADEQDEGKMKDEDDGKRRGECLSAALSQAGCGTTTAYALHTRFCLPDRIWAAPKRDGWCSHGGLSDSIRYCGLQWAKAAFRSSRTCGGKGALEQSPVGPHVWRELRKKQHPNVFFTFTNKNTQVSFKVNCLVFKVWVVLL